MTILGDIDYVHVKVVGGLSYQNQNDTNLVQRLS